jgi:tRNA(Ile)-lysidine synthase
LTAEGLIAKIRAHFGAPPAQIAVAVSGGSDSLALLHLVHAAFADQTRIHAATVDHGLRPEAAQEADAVAQACTALGIPHDTLRWQGWNGQGNLQDQARQARYALLTAWCLDNGIADLAVGHTADDQAETVLMRLARSSGVQGLSGMRPRRDLGGVILHRPLLTATRGDLRDVLRSKGLKWIDDPSNSDTTYDRVAMRAALPDLEKLGITGRVLSDVAANMARANDALAQYTAQAARDCAQLRAGCVVLDPDQLAQVPPEIVRRLVLHALNWVAGPGYPPRRAALGQLMRSIASHHSATLAGCRIAPFQGKLWIGREYKAVEGIETSLGGLWDNRWRLIGPQAEGVAQRPLSPQGATMIRDDLRKDAPRWALEASVAAWQGPDLLAAPLATGAGEWRAEPVQSDDLFAVSLLSH